MPSDEGSFLGSLSDMSREKPGAGDSWLLPRAPLGLGALSALALLSEAVLPHTWDGTLKQTCISFLRQFCCLKSLYLWEVHKVHKYILAVSVTIFAVSSATDPPLKLFLLFSYFNLSKQRCLISPMHAYHSLPPVSLLLPPGFNLVSSSKHACGVMSWGVLTSS